MVKPRYETYVILCSDNFRVIVRVGSSQMWPQGNDSALQPGKEPSQDYFKNEGFEINWSLFKWVSVKTN